VNISLPRLGRELPGALRSVLESGQPIMDLELGDEEAGRRFPEQAHARASVFPIRDAAGEVIAVSAVIAEIDRETPRRRELERQLSEEQAIAGVFEESLMPEDLPQIDRLELAARFLPAGERNRVGGDFYDVFEARGSLFITIGDVAGKGPKAATITALARHVVRAIALYEQRPAMLLERLREMLVARENAPLVTVMCAVMERPRRARRLTIASSAHPRPLLVRPNGEAREVGGLNPLLRYTPPGEFQERTITLRRRDRLFFYTDGLTDARAPARVITPEELGGALSGREGLELGQLLDNVIGWAVGPGGNPRDDIAVLALERR
jgi:sigma-B regulation protein RsbU (phosphoserine phosphatase)